MKRTILYDWHKKHGELIDFNGWEMPVRYTSINEEHLAVRNNWGIFDVSHMGRYFVSGSDAQAFLDYLVPRDIKAVKESQAAYTFMLNEQAGFKDDLIITKFNQDNFLVVCNAGNREKIWNWMKQHAENRDVTLTDKSNSVMIAAQGPNARETLAKITDDELPKRFRTGYITLNGIKVLFSGTGYTGEDGGEITIFAEDVDDLTKRATELWEKFVELGAKPCGLGARDTLRMEVGYPLYGNDIDETTHVLESGLAFKPFMVKDKEPGYIGKRAVLEKEGKIERFRVMFKLLKRGVPRHGYKVIIDGEEKGVVTSGTMSPLTKDCFGMAYVPISHKEPGSKFFVDIRGRLIEAEVLDGPIYKK